MPNNAGLRCVCARTCYQDARKKSVQHSMLVLSSVSSKPHRFGCEEAQRAGDAQEVQDQKPQCPYTVYHRSGFLSFISGSRVRRAPATPCEIKDKKPPGCRHAATNRGC
eukprot:1792605-Rhodomonas_salina.1